MLPSFWLTVALAAPEGPQPPLPTVPLLANGVVIMAEVADDPEERRLGLMMRTELADGAGMLFVYAAEAPRSFWMKNTLLPLDIAYINGAGVVVSISQMQPRDLSGVSSGAPAQYALELPQGWCLAHGLSVGDSVDGLPGR